MTPTLYVKQICDLVEASVDGKPFHYLSGPMSWQPHFNIERFDQVEDKLTAAGWTMVSPARLDGEEIRKHALQSPDGNPDDLKNVRGVGNVLARDTCVVAMPNCVGIMLLEGWHWSTGALWETRIAEFFKKKMYEYQDCGNGFTLSASINRRQRIAELAASEAVLVNQ